MYCITREDMKFGQYFIPARTKATVIGKPHSHEVNIPGLELRLAIDLFDAHPNKGTGVPSSEVKFNNEFEGANHFGLAKSYMTGIAIWTRGDQVYMDAGDNFYTYYNLSKWQMGKIFRENIPKYISKAEFSNDYRLDSLLEYLEEEFSEWVQRNCDFHKLTKRDIENGEGFDGAWPGDRILSGKGMVQFEEKKLEYQKRLEVIGFTYDFKGGLIWD